MADRVRFYPDQDIPAAVARGLRLRGVDVLTPQEAGRCGLGDQDQLEFAKSGGRVIVTHDAAARSPARLGFRHLLVRK